MVVTSAPVRNTCESSIYRDRVVWAPRYEDCHQYHFSPVAVHHRGSVWRSKATQHVASKWKRKRKGQSPTTPFQGSLGYTVHHFLVAPLVGANLYHGDEPQVTWGCHLGSRLGSTNSSSLRWLCSLWMDFSSPVNAWWFFFFSRELAFIVKCLVSCVLIFIIRKHSKWADGCSPWWLPALWLVFSP